MLYEENPKMVEVMFERDEYRYLYEKELRNNKILLKTLEEKNNKIKELQKLIDDGTEYYLKRLQENLIKVLCFNEDDEDD